jgi:CRP-like cAMP-binding protein
MPEPFDVAKLYLDPGSEIARLVARYSDIECLRYRDGEYLIREGEASQEVFIVLEGAFVVEQAVMGSRPAILACITCGLENPSIVGEMAFLGSFKRTASLRISGSTLALRLQPAHVEAIIQDFPSLTRAICRQFSNRLKEANEALRLLQGCFALQSSQRMASAGDVLFTAGEPATELFQLMMGCVELERNGVRVVVTPEELPQGFIEPLPFLRGSTQMATARVVDAAFLVAIGQASREAFVRCQPSLILELLGHHEPG